MGIVNFLKENWAVIAAAPWAFVAFAAIALGVGFAAGRFLASEKIGNLQSRLDRRDEEISSLKGQLSTQSASPDRKALRLEIAKFIAEGEGFQEKCRVEGDDGPSDQELKAWVSRVEERFLERLDASYVSRFNSDAGLPSVVLTGLVSDRQRKIWSWLERRNQRLNQFLAELS